MPSLSPKPKILTLFGLALALGALAFLYWLDSPLRGSQTVNFPAPMGDTPDGDLLVGEYTPGERLAGVLLLEGFGSDQIALRPLAAEFARSGAHTFTLDFSGHSRSGGALGFDNAATDRLAQQTLIAKEKFKALSGLQDAQILVVGHSLGARVALQAATMDVKPVAGLILIGAQVNLIPNPQAQFFTGVGDTSLAWVQALGPNNPPVNILLLSGAWDDILTPAAAQTLLGKLAGTPAQPDTLYGSIARKTARKMLIFDRLLHNYEIYSPRVMGMATNWAARLWGMPDSLPAPAPPPVLRLWGWAAGLIGLFAAVLGGIAWAAPPPPAPQTIEIVHLRRYLWAKLLLWLAALPFTAALFGLTFALPWGNPAFNLIYVGFIGSYGVVLWILYRAGRMPGTKGAWRGEPPRKLSTRGGAISMGVFAALVVYTAAFARTGWYFIFPINERLIWLALFTPVTALGFWIGLREAEMVGRAAPGRLWPQIAASLIGLFPFFLWTGFLIGLGSLSGVFGNLQGVIYLSLALLSGALLRKLNNNPALTAVLQAILLYALVLPTGVLFLR
jgi:pimeloyl-ACP methyl ester carboxylesterase